jgi:hypothetical protein
MPIPLQMTKLRGVLPAVLAIAAAVLAIAAAALAIAATQAAAARPATVPGPSSFTTGLVDQGVFESPSTAVRSRWLDRARALGSQWVRLDVRWALIAPPRPPAGFQPADPSSSGYSWSQLDGEVRSAAAAGQHVLLLILDAPRWALGRGAPRSATPGSWEPQPRALGSFAHALAQRYSGSFPDPLAPASSLPRVGAYQVWNEPNLAEYLAPQWVRSRGGWTAESPRLYRAMLNAAYAAIKAVAPQTPVLAAGTAPYGDPPGHLRMHPVVFWRDLLCLSATLRPLRCGEPAHLDGLDHHPYSYSPTIHAYSPLDASIPDLGRIQRVVRAAERARTVLPAGPKPMWVTEINFASDPPVRGGVPLARQARYLSLTFYELWRQGVSHVFWFLIRDYPHNLEAGAGLYFTDGRAKPAAFAFAFPFMALRARDGVLTIWGRAPHAGTVVIERAAGRGRWRAIMRLATTGGGIFYARRAIAATPGLRAVQGARASLEFSVS